MELTMKELAVTNMTERQRTYRANYRQRIAGWYNGFLHIAIIYTIGLTALYIYISNIRNLSWAELATVPVVFLFCNFFEWFLHRYIMHRPWKNPICRAVYNRHTLQHHQFFTDTEMRFVTLKSEAQLDGQTLHRARTRLVGQRTALINQLRAVLLERGIVVAKGRRRLEEYLARMLDDGSAGLRTLSGRILLLIGDMRREWRDLDTRIATLTAELVEQARVDEAARRLTTIPGFGALNATALVAAIGAGETFCRARDLAAWLGLVPRQATTGGRPRLLGITKRGNVYLRTLLVHGARAALPSLSASATSLGAWLRALTARTHKNKVIVALAGKLARIAWAVLRSGTNYTANPIRATVAG